MRIGTMDKNTKGRRSSKGQTKKSKKKLKIKNIFTALLYLATLGILVVMTLLYGPWAGFRDWLVTTAMTTMTHQYFATWFFDEETIEHVLNKNKIVEFDESTNTDLIVSEIVPDTGNYKDEFDKQILQRDAKNNDYKIIPINGKGYDGYLVAVYDPSRVRTVVTEHLGVTGQYVTQMSAKHEALVAINGGGFDDPNFVGTGGSPIGVTFTYGEPASRGEYHGEGGVIGFDSNNKLILGKMTTEEANKKGIRDAVTFGPFLIVNGKKAEIRGNGGWGTAPRTAIGQRQDGIVLFLVLDGRRVTKPGASMHDMADILMKYGAYNASNLDGGTSTVLVVNHVIVNDPIDISGAHRTRPVASAFILEKDASDDGDATVVQDRIDKLKK